LSFLLFFIKELIFLEFFQFFLTAEKNRKIWLLEKIEGGEM
jgi:hypothetical protein